MRLEDLPNHHLDTLIEVHVIGSRVRKSGRDRHKVDVYVRAGALAPEDLAIPEWSTDAEASRQLAELYQARGKPLIGSSPRDIAISALKAEGVARKSYAR